MTLRKTMHASPSFAGLDGKPDIRWTNVQDPSNLGLQKETHCVAANVMKDRVAEGTRYLQFDTHVGRDEVPVGYWTRFNDF
jgi:hypothetical protein